MFPYQQGKSGHLPIGDKNMDYKEAHDLKEQLVDKVYSRLRKEQDEDWKFYTDTFAVPQIDTTMQTLQKTGRGRRMVDNPAEHILTANPQVFITHELKGKLESAKKIAELCNNIWIPYWKRQNPNPFKEATKKVLLRGETFVKILHNEDWVTKERFKRGLPIHLLIPDSRNIYVDEDASGKITKLLVFHFRQPWSLKRIYPDWTTDKTDNVEWLEIWTEGERYFEADGKAVLEGENIYGSIPFARALAGFGQQSAEGNLEDLIVGRLRYERDNLTRDCAMTTDLDSIFHQFANHNITVQPTERTVQIDEEDFQANYTREKGHANILQYGIKVEHDVETLPEPQAFEYYYSIIKALDRSDPLVMGGLPAGSSGRQDDLSLINSMRRYETVVENIEHLFSDALTMALKIIFKVPTLADAVGLSEKDKDDNYLITVKLKASDPIEEDQKITLGDRLWAQGQGSISLNRNHTQYQGMTESESDKEIARIMADNVTMYNPEVAEVMGMTFAEETGMGKWLEMARQKRMMAEQQQEALRKQPAPTTMERVKGEVKTPLGRETMDMALSNRGARNPSARYTRGE